jgi:hypothetical protein
MNRQYEPNPEYDINPDDEREVEVEDDPAGPTPPPTLDPDERVEDIEEELVASDDDREEPAW